MKVLTFSLVSDWIFSAITAFLLSFIVLYYFVPRAFSFIYAALFACLFLLLVIKLTLKRREKTTLRKKDEKFFREVFAALELLEDDETLGFFTAVFQKNGIAAEKEKDCLFLPEKKERTFFRLSFVPITKTDVVRAFNRINKDETAVIYCEPVFPEVAAFAARFGGKVLLKTKKEIFPAIKESGIFPPVKFRLKEEKQPVSKKLRALLNKKKAKTFFSFGLAFLILSVFAPFKIYYVICCGVSLVYSLVLRFFGSETEEKRAF